MLSETQGGPPSPSLHFFCVQPERRRGPVAGREEAEEGLVLVRDGFGEEGDATTDRGWCVVHIQRGLLLLLLQVLIQHEFGAVKFFLPLLPLCPNS